MSKTSRKKSFKFETANPELLLNNIAKSFNKEASDYMFYLYHNGDYYNVLKCSK